MKKINLAISGCMGRMGQQLIKSSKKNKDFKLVALTENILINRKFHGIRPELNSDIAQSIADQVKEAKNLKNQLDKVAKNSEEISENFGVASFGGLDEVLNKLGMGKIGKQLGVEQAAESARGMAQNIQEAANSGGKGLTKEKIKQLGLEKKLGNLSGAAAANKVKGMSGMTKAMMALKAGAKTMFMFAKKALGPIGLIIEAIQAIIRVDKASGEVAKAMGTSAARAREINAEMADAAGSFCG